MRVRSPVWWETLHSRLIYEGTGGWVISPRAGLVYLAPPPVYDAMPTRDTMWFVAEKSEGVTGIWRAPSSFAIQREAV